MNVSAILVVGGSEDDTAQFAGIPLVLFDVLGKSVLLRVLDRLENYGITHRTVVVGRGFPLPSFPPNTQVITSDQKNIWETASRSCSELTTSETGIVLALGLGRYNEIDYRDLIRFHLRQRLPVTGAVDPNGDCAMAFVCAASRQKELSYLFRHRLRTTRGPHAAYLASGYSNPLLEPADFRRLAIDAFCGNADVAPDGEEVKPGVWISSRASVHPSARILAPAYIGHYARIRASAVVTRCSTVEHHADIGTGAIVENATILPKALIGPALDVSHAVVGLKRFCHLGRSIEIEINDKRLVSQVSTAPLRFVEQLASFATFLPAQFLRGLVSRNTNGRRLREEIPQSQDAILAPTAEQHLSPHLAGVRRYGDE